MLRDRVLNFSLAIGLAVLFLVLAVALQGAGVFGLRRLGIVEGRNPFTLPGAGMSILLAMLANMIFFRWREKQWWTPFWLACRPAPMNRFVEGMVVGAAMPLAIVGCFALAGAVSWGSASGGIAPGPTTILLVLLAGAASEEMLARGFLLTSLARMTNFPVAAIFTSGLFASGHIGNNSASLPSVANTFLAGAVLATLVWRSRNLWLGIGAHFGWNIMLPLLGTNLSGFQLRLHSKALQWKLGSLDTTWWTGGDYGIEAGAITTVALLLGLLLTLRYPFRRNAEEWV
jgi:uncharacterized protein